jgi:hypothetical protein
VQFPRGIPLAANANCGPRPHGQDAPHHGSVENLGKIEDPYGKTMKNTDGKKNMKHQLESTKTLLAKYLQHI